jgi:transposase
MSAVRIGKAYLAGTAKEVWVPDKKTQERRDWFHAHRKATKRCTQMRARLLSYLSDNGVRLKTGTTLIAQSGVEEQLRQKKEWSPRQWQVIEGMLMELRHGEEQRKHWRSLIAQEVMSDPLLLSIVRLCGVRELVAFALGAIIGDISRFASPAKLVKYVGLDPALDESGEGKWEGGHRSPRTQRLALALNPGSSGNLPDQRPGGQVGQKTLCPQRLTQFGRGCHRA